MPDNPFVFGEIIERDRFIDREKEIQQLVRELTDAQKIFLLSPRRFGKSSLVAMAFLKLKKRHIRTVSITVSSYASYTQFLEKFAEKVIRAVGAWERVKDLAKRTWRHLQPVMRVGVDPVTGEVSLTLGREPGFAPGAIASDIFALPGELARNGGFRMAICLDEFQQITNFNGEAVENALRNEVQQHREVGYVFSGSQPSMMKQMLSPKRPFYKAGPTIFLDKIPPDAWRAFIVREFQLRNRTITEAAIEALLAAANLIPYDVQRIAHELWDYAELQAKKTLDVQEVSLVVEALVAGHAAQFELLWEQLPARQRAVLHALADRGPEELLSHAIRQQYRLGPASSVQKALQSLDERDILDRYQNRYFFLDPLFALWIQKHLQ